MQIHCLTTCFTHVLHVLLNKLHDKKTVIILEHIC